MDSERRSRGAGKIDLAAVTNCADICLAITCFDAVASVSWDDLVLAGI